MDENGNLDIGALDLNFGQEQEPIVSEGQPVESPDSLLNPFLKDIPEADRNVIAPYISKWDAGVTKKFQEIHESYKPYKELGLDTEGLQQAVTLYRAFNDEPEKVYQVLQEFLKMNEELEEGTPQVEQTPTPLPEFEGVPAPFVEKFTQMEQALAQMNEFFQNEQQTRQQAAQEKELDTLLSAMHTKHGDFDEDYVVAKLAAGLTPDQALESYKSLTEKLTAPKTSRPAPSLLGGAGGVPTGQVDPSKMSEAETRDFVAKMIAAANQG